MYEAIAAAHRNQWGVGVVFTGEVDNEGLTTIGIDFDHIYDRAFGETDDTAMLARHERAERFLTNALAQGAYVETSPSGTGMHVIARARPLTDSDDKRKNHVEIYTSKRYFTLTGHQIV